MLARVIAFPAHRVRRRPSALVFASLGELDDERRVASRLFGACALCGCLLTALAVALGA
jgi:hypothetical protein